MTYSNVRKRLISLTLSLSFLLAFLPTQSFADSTTMLSAFDSISLADITISGTPAIKSLSDVKTLPTSVNGIPVKWSIENQSIANSVAMVDGQITAVTRPQATIDNALSAVDSITYTATTGKVTTPAYDSVVRLNAEFAEGDKVLNKPFYLIVKRDDNALTSNMYLDNFEHGSIKGWDGTQILDTNNVLNNASKKINSTATSAKYNSGFSRAMPVNVANYKHIQSAGFRIYMNSATSSRAQNFQLKNGVNSNIIAHMRISADKVYVSNGQGSVTAVASLTPVDQISGTTPAVLLQQKWYEVQYVVDFANTYGTVKDAHYDVYIYEYNYQTGEKTLFAYKTGMLAAVANTAAPADSNLYISRLYTDPYNLQTSSFDDFNITDYTVDVDNAKTALTLPTDIRSGVKLPTIGANETKISWATTNPSVTITDGVISIAPEAQFPNVDLTATISKGESVTGAINATATKAFVANLNNVTPIDLTPQQKVDFDLANLSITNNNKIEVKSLSDFANNGVLTTVGAKSSAISYTVESKFSEYAFDITGGNVSFTRPSSILNVDLLDGKYTANTGKITPITDNVVKVKATATNGVATAVKYFDIIIKRDENAIISNTFLDNFEHGSIEKWLPFNISTVPTISAVIDNTNIVNNTSNKILPLYKSNTGIATSVYDDGVIPIGIDAKQHIQVAGFRQVNTAAMNASNFIAYNAAGIQVAYVRMVSTTGGIKFLYSDAAGSTLANFTEVKDGSQNTIVVPNSQWFEVQAVANFKDNYIVGTNKDSYWDLYIYSYDYATGTKTLLAKKQGIKSAFPNASTIIDNNLRFTRVRLEPYKSGDTYIDDVYITDYTNDIVNVKDKLTLPANIESGYKLPETFANETNILWQTPTTGVQINNGVITAPSDANVTIVATITKGEQGGITVTDTKSFDVALKGSGIFTRDTFDIVDINGDKVTTITAGKEVYASYIGAIANNFNGAIIFAAYDIQNKIINVKYLPDMYFSSDVSEYSSDSYIIPNNTVTLKAFIWKDGMMPFAKQIVAQGL